MIMKIVKKDGETIIALEGRLDTVTAPELANTVKDLEFKKLVIALEKLQYISSAGLRALLLCQKTADQKEASMEVKNPTAAVANVMKMSGFDKVLTIKEE